MEKKNIKIVFFGTPEFAVASLDRILNCGFNVSAVVTMPDKIAGRGHKLIKSDVKKYAEKHGLRILQPEKLKSEEFIRTLQEIDADLFIVIAFRMLPEIVWSMPPLGTFNLHASLLPKYRGAAPINRAIMNGEKETGITTFFLKHEIDTGDMIEQRTIKINDEDNAGTIHDKLMELGADMVVSTIDHIINDTLNTKPQPDGEFINAPKIFKEDCHIDWTNSSTDIHNQIRGLSPYPAAYSTLIDNSGKEFPIKIFESKLSNMPLECLKPGEIKHNGKNMWIATGDGMLEIVSLQPAGKKRMDVSSFLLGYHPYKTF